MAPQSEGTPGGGGLIDSRARLPAHRRSGSPSTRKRDETIKRRLYERFGVTEYWVVDPATEVIHVHRRTRESFEGPATLSRAAGDVLRTDLLPGLEMPLGRIFADLRA